MFAIRQILISALFFAAVPPAAVLAASDTVQYVGGTVKSIPVNSNGTFNFEDAKEFRFTYNGSVFKLPYDQITSTEHREGGCPARHARVPGHVADRQPSQADAGHQLHRCHRRRRNAEFRTGGVPGCRRTGNHRGQDGRPCRGCRSRGIELHGGAISVWKTKRNQALGTRKPPRTRCRQAAQNTAPTQPGQLAPGTK